MKLITTQQNLMAISGGNLGYGIVASGGAVLGGGVFGFLGLVIGLVIEPSSEERVIGCMLISGTAGAVGGYNLATSAYTLVYNWMNS